MNELSKQWLKKYYPVEASEVSKRKALDHSIRKWKGLQDKILEKYKLRIDFFYGNLKEIKSENTILSIDSSSCSLCTYYLYEANLKCPLQSHKSCDGSVCGGGDYKKFREGDSKPMLKKLKQAKLRAAKHA
jgi:hypothetical protein